MSRGLCRCVSDPYNDFQWLDDGQFSAFCFPEPATNFGEMEGLVALGGKSEPRAGYRVHVAAGTTSHCTISPFSEIKQKFLFRPFPHRRSRHLSKLIGEIESLKFCLLVESRQTHRLQKNIRVPYSFYGGHPEKLTLALVLVTLFDDWPTRMSNLNADTDSLSTISLTRQVKLLLCERGRLTIIRCSVPLTQMRAEVGTGEELRGVLAFG